MRRGKVLPNDLFGKEFDLSEKELEKVTNKLLELGKEAISQHFANFKKKDISIHQYNYVLQSRYLNKKTYKKIGEELGVATTRIRDIQEMALSRIRKRKEVKEIYKEYLEGKEI